MNITLPQNGGCQCSSIRYRITGQPLALYACHCTDCQKQSSSGFGMSLWVARADIAFSGELKFWTTHGGSGNPKLCARCGDCGTRLYHGSTDEQKLISLKAGSLDDRSWLRPTAHLWMRSAQPWVASVLQGQRCYETEPDDDDELLRQWQEQVAI